MTDSTLVQIDNLTKSYGGVHALQNVRLEIKRGEIHALCGENGAGKSTLIKCLSGVVVPDSGTVKVANRTLRFGDVRACESAGIAVMHQESTVFPDLSALDNIFVGREPRRAFGLLLDRRRMRREATEILQHLQLRFDIDRPMTRVSVAARQMTAMARALSQRCQLLVMDEPTASMSARETQTLMQIVRRLRDHGVTVLYVSHRLDEVFDIADRVTVFRDGQHVVTRPRSQINKDQLVHWMVGREIEELGRRRSSGSATGDVRLEVKELCRPAVFDKISLTAREGEIVGLAGLVGAGRSEVARCIFGIDRYESGQVLLDGQPLPAYNVQAAIQQGLALVPEDRQHEGLILPMTVRANVSLPCLRRLTRWSLVDRLQEQQLTGRVMSDLGIKAAGRDVLARTLSGGNQQKLVLGKWVATKPRVLILDEPTRGVDVGAKTQVHQVIRRLAEEGMATLVISSELAELLTICDRILVMRGGRISGELDGPTATQAQILKLALPEKEDVSS